MIKNRPLYSDLHHVGKLQEVVTPKQEKAKDRSMPPTAKTKI